MAKMMDSDDCVVDPDWTAYRDSSWMTYCENGDDPMLDVYSFGMIVYQLLTGVHAGSGMRRIQKMSAMETPGTFAKELVDACLARRYDRITFEEICKRLKDNAHLLLPDINEKELSDAISYYTSLTANDKLSNS